MKIALSVPGKFHTFDLARELHARGLLTKIFTGYPRFKLRNENLPKELIQTFPWFHAPYMGLLSINLLPEGPRKEWENLLSVSFSDFVARNLPDCDLYVGLSGSALSAGQKAHLRGIKFICDRGASHIRAQDQLLREEHALWGVPFSGIDQRTIVRDESEYAEADCITVPSTFVYRSFIEQGIPADRLKILPYGVNLRHFHPVDKPDDERFDILFVGAMTLQKGVQYIVQAFNKINHPNKTLTFVGASNPTLIKKLKSFGIWPDSARLVGHMQQSDLKTIMSRSHVLVLPSIQDGFGMVMAQAMACGCPVIASRHTGGEDLFTDGVEGFIVPIRDVLALTERLQQMADQTTLRAEMGVKALEKVQLIGGWHDYGNKAMEIYREVKSA